MMAPFIYIIMLVAFGLLALGFLIKDYAVGTIASMFLIVLGVYVSIYGIVEISNFVTQALGLVLICVGAYILLRSGIEILKMEG